MLYFFVILGTLTLAAALAGLMTARDRTGRGVALHLVSLGFIGAAWWFTHLTTAGLVCLIVAAVLEAAARALPGRSGARKKTTEKPTGRDGTRWRDITDSPLPGPTDMRGPAMPTAGSVVREQPDEDAMLAAEWTPEQGEIAAAKLAAEAARARIASGSSQRETQPIEPEDAGVDEGGARLMAAPVRPEWEGPADDVGEGEPSADAAEESPAPLSLRTEVLFSRECGITPSVFVASLRRNGRRDARVEESGGDGPSRIRMGDVIFEYQIESGPRDPGPIEETLTHFDHPPEIGERVRSHASRVVLRSLYGIGTPRDLIVRLHHHAHAALTEFTPVVAAFWADARMLTPVEQLPAMMEYARSPAHAMWRTCTHIRGFALAGDNEGMLLFDSVGLLAFGLPDVQVIAPASHEAAARATIDLVTDRIFTSGCDLPHGTEYTASDGLTWRVNYTRSAFVPDREVVQLALKT